jgi:hypothetical protein
MKKTPRCGKVVLRRVTTVKKKNEKPGESTLEQEYVGVFQPHVLPHQGLFTDNNSLEQPSPLTDYPSTATPGVGVSIELQPRRHAKLEPDIH